MSNAGRIGVVLATVVVLVVLFILLSPEADDDSNTAQTPTTTVTPTTTTPATTTTPDDAAPAPAPPPAADHEPTFETVRVAGGKPVGGIKKVTVKKGARARIQVTSSDTSDEVHLHGYDITRDVKPGSRARFSFEANAEGIFELELHGSHTQIAQLTVEP